MASEKKTILWSVEEIELFLSLLGDARIQSALDGARRNESVYREISAKMAQHGFQRTWIQCREKQKKMKCDYNREKVLLSSSGYSGKVTRWYARLDAIYGHRPSSFGREAGLDSASALLQSTQLEDNGSATTDSTPPRSCEDNTLSSRLPSPVPGTSAACTMVEETPSPRLRPTPCGERARESARRSLSLSHLSGKRKRSEPSDLAAVLQDMHQHNKENDRLRLENDRLRLDNERRSLELREVQAARAAEMATRAAEMATRAAEQEAEDRARAARSEERFLTVLEAIVTALARR